MTRTVHWPHRLYCIQVDVLIYEALTKALAQRSNQLAGSWQITRGHLSNNGRWPMIGLDCLSYLDNLPLSSSVRFLSDTGKQARTTRNFLCLIEPTWITERARRGDDSVHVASLGRFLTVQHSLQRLRSSRVQKNAKQIPAAHAGWMEKEIWPPRSTVWAFTGRGFNRQFQLVHAVKCLQEKKRENTTLMDFFCIWPQLFTRSQLRKQTSSQSHPCNASCVLLRCREISLDVSITKQKNRTLSTEEMRISWWSRFHIP